MKKIYLLIYCLLSFLISNAQNYHPFPYDSVFFAESPESKMLPLVKTNNADDLFHITNTKREIGNRPFQDFSMNTEYAYPIQSWLGKVSFINNEIQFISIVNDSIKIDLNKNLNEKDTCQFNVPHLYGEGISGYVEITYTSKMFVGGDSIKQYEFTFYDDNFTPHNFDTNYNFSPSEANLADYVFWVSKNGGVLKTPDFNHFPFCTQYEYQGKITDYLNLNTSHHYKAYKMNVGDEIHTFKFKDISYNQSWRAKRILLEQTYNPSENSYTNVFDYWELYTELINGENGYEYISTPSYEQQTEVLYVGTGNIPDGFPYLYNHDQKQFIKDDLSYVSILDDSIRVMFHDDISTYYDYSKYIEIGLRGIYYNLTGGGSYQAAYNPVYYKINGEEWGTPYPDSFLLNLIENNNAPEVNFKINNHEITLSSGHNIQNLRIYNIQGSLRKVCSSKDIEQPISIQSLEAGVYIICCWNGKKLYSYKFIKS